MATSNNRESNETKMRMVPYGTNFDKIPTNDSKAIVPVIDVVPLASIPPTKHVFYTCAALPAPPQPLFLEGAPPKGPIVKLLVDTKLLPPKPNETLVGVKRNCLGEIVCAKYTTEKPRPSFEGVRAHPSKVKFIPPEEAPKKKMLSEGPPRRRSTVADLETEIAHLHTVVDSVEKNHQILGRTVLTTNARVDELDTTRKRMGLISTSLGGARNRDRRVHTHNFD